MNRPFLVIQIPFSFLKSPFKKGGGGKCEILHDPPKGRYFEVGRIGKFGLEGFSRG